MKTNLSTLFTTISKVAKAPASGKTSFESDVPAFPGQDVEGEAVNSTISETEMDSVSGQINEALRDSVVGDDEINPEKIAAADQLVSESKVSVEAATIAYFGARDTDGYTKRAASFAKSHGDNPITGFSTGIESFDVQNFSAYQDESVKFNLYATKQSPFAALFAPLLVGTPDKVDWSISLDRVIFGHFAEHSLDQSIVDAQGLRPLQSAYSDINALKNNATDLVPFYSEDSKQYFVEDSKLSVTETKLDNTTFPTTALKTGVEVPFITLGQHPGRLEAYTRNAQIHRNIRLAEIVVEVTDKDGANPETFSFNTKSMPRTLFTSLGQGNSQETIISFRNTNFAIGKRGVSKNGIGDPTSALLQSYIDADRQIRLNIDANGTCKHDRGGLKLNGDVELLGLYDLEGTKIQTPAALADLQFKVVGYKVKARTTNSDLAHISLLADMVTETDICRIGLRPPIIAHSSLMNNQDSGTSRSQKLDVLIELTKVSMASDAMLTFLEYCDTVRDYCLQRNQDNLDEDLGDIFEPDAIAGIGRKILRPEFIELPDIDLRDVVNSQSSANKVTDVRRYTAGLISDTVSSLIQNSRMLTAMPIYAPTSSIVGKVVTSPRIENFLMIEGDPRLAGHNKFQVVADPATVLTDTFYIQLSVDNAPSGHFHPLNSGYCLYIPELVGEFPIKRGSSNVNEMAVQGQFEHVWNVPVLAKIKINGLTEFIREKTRLETLTEIKNNPLKMENVNP